MKKLPKITAIDIERELCKRSFYFFAQYFWDTIIAEKPVWNWHIKYLCDELQVIGKRVAERLPKEFDYLIINIPPGSSKSTVVSEMYPIWCWIIDPSQRFICASYSSTMADEIAEKSYNIYTSEKFKRLFPKLVEKKSGGKTNFKNGLRGERIPTSTGSSITGQHAHQIIIDDPITPTLASSETERKTANTWISETIASRKVSLTVTVTILVMQRLHEQDCTGFLLSKKNLNIKHICIPAELTENVKPKELSKYYTDGLFDIVRKTRQNLSQAKIELGSYGYAGQMLQEPSPKDGGVLKKNWFPIIKAAAAPQGCIVNFQLDTAYTDKEKNDPSAMVSYFKHENTVYITNSISVYKEFPELCRWIPTHVREHEYSDFSTLRVEPKATGKTTVQQLRLETNLNIIEDKAPTVDKVTRARACSPKVESGRVILLEGHWNESFLNQVAAFPNAAHDDELDCLTAIIERELINNSNIGEYVFG